MKSGFTCKPLRVSSRALGKPSPPAVAEQLGLRQLGISKPGDALRRMLVLALQSRVLPTTSARVLDSLGHALDLFLVFGSCMFTLARTLR